MDNIVKRFKTRSKISIDFCDLWALRQHFIKNSHDFVVDFFFRIHIIKSCLFLMRLVHTGYPCWSVLYNRITMLSI